MMLKWEQILEFSATNIHESPFRKWEIGKSLKEFHIFHTSNLNFLSSSIFIYSIIIELFLKSSNLFLLTYSLLSFSVNQLTKTKSFKRFANIPDLLPGSILEKIVK